MRAWALRSRSQSRLGNKEDAWSLEPPVPGGELGADLSSPLLSFCQSELAKSPERPEGRNPRKGSGPRGSL